MIQENSQSASVPTLHANSVIGIVNRGEAALRAIRGVRDFNALKGWNLKTVTFYQHVDRDAPFVKQADWAYPLAPMKDAKTQSTTVIYNNKEQMMQALAASGCDTVWVGWGFLSEDPEFARMVEQAEMVFIGPSSASMTLLGDKIQAKRLAEEAEVPVTPWSNEAISDAAAARKVAEIIGFPLIVKAANTGGGRGIRKVLTPEELDAAFNSAAEEAFRLTGEKSLFIERLVSRARHLEVQIVGDASGNVVSYGVRDCSVQRKNQKIIEETPPPHIPQRTLDAMEAAARRLIKAAKYRSAGTVEFIYDNDADQFYFMEVNTRLQVEHPISEMRYGVDLVRAQLEVAAGNEWTVEGQPRGVVVEVRLNAEDPERDFTPAPGLVTHFVPPGGLGIRVDSGITQGCQIPVEFDSMVAKIIAQGETRQQAFALLIRALREMKVRIEGGTTNRAFLLKLLTTRQIVEGGVLTSFVEEARLNTLQDLQEHWEVALVVCAIRQYIQRYEEALLNFKQRFQRSSPPPLESQRESQPIKVRHAGKVFEFQVKSVGNNIFHVTTEDSLIVVQYLWSEHEGVLVHGRDRYQILTVQRGNVLQLEINCIPYAIEQDTQGAVRAPSPAMVISVQTAEGQEVNKGDVLLTLEAMKMEMVVVAPDHGVVSAVRVLAGEQVAAGQLLMEIETADEGQHANAEQLGSEKGEPTAEVAFQKLGLPPITASRTAETMHWERMVRDYLSAFQGYDADSPVEVLHQMVHFAQQRVGYYEKLITVLLQALEIFVAIERVFSREKIVSEGAASAMDSQELLMHFFWRANKKVEGLPEDFVQLLKMAIRWYPWAELEDNEGCTRALYRMYLAHARLRAESHLVLETITALEEIFQRNVIPRILPQITHTLSQVAVRCQSEQPSLADAALHARFQLVDLPLIEKNRAKRKAELQELLETLAGSTHQVEDMPEHLLQRIVDAGNHIMLELVHMGQNGEHSQSRQRLALQLLALRLNRDRQVLDSRWVCRGNLSFCYVIAEESSSEGENAGDSEEESAEHKRVCQSTVAILSPSQISSFFTHWKHTLKELESLENQSSLSHSKSGGQSGKSVRQETLPRQTEVHRCDVTIYLNAPECLSKETICEMLNLNMDAPPAISITVAQIATSNGNGAEQLVYHTYQRNEEGIFVEEKPKRFLSPLMCRELRLHRFRNFELTLAYRSDSVFVYAAKARTNNRDERLFALVHTPEVIPEYDKKGQLLRIVAFEHAFIEAVQAIRAEQARRKRRLYWNRIFVHIRSVLNNSMEQIKDYAKRLTPLTSGIGLEKVVVYTRATQNGAIRESELLFENISGPVFSLRARKPSHIPLQPMDDYVTKVVRARQRKAVHPYQVIRMITADSSSTGQFPPGTFEEYDIVLEAEGEKQTVVPYTPDNGNGTGARNIIFGVVCNYMPPFTEGMSRVLLLNDPTTDMCALGEFECRRIIAAIDLAQSRDIPLEWVTISAGARIDMQSGTENLDWTARVLRRIIEFTQAGGEINIIVAGINVGAQSYWNSEATMLMHTKGLLIMTDNGTMQLTGKKALDFSGSVSAEDNLGIGGVEKIMGPNGEAQVRVRNLTEAFEYLFRHYYFTYSMPGQKCPLPVETADPPERDITQTPYVDTLGQGFTTIGDIFSKEKNPERKKPFDMRQVMGAIIDRDQQYFERWHMMRDAETAIVWETRIGGYAAGLIGIESKALARLGVIPNDGPESWTGGTLFPQSSKKVARAINAFSGKVPLVVIANLSGFDGSPESLRQCQLEFGAEIGRAVVNFQGPILFIVVARYHGGAYVVFSQALNKNLTAVALENTYASVIGGAPAAAVVFFRQVLKETWLDKKVIEAQKKLKKQVNFKQSDFDKIFQQVKRQKQNEFAKKFDTIHSVQRAKQVGSITEIISPTQLRPYIIHTLTQ